MARVGLGCAALLVQLGCLFSSGGGDDGDRSSADAAPRADSSPPPIMSVREARLASGSNRYITLSPVIVTGLWCRDQPCDLYVADPASVSGDADRDLGLRVIRPRDLWMEMDRFNYHSSSPIREEGGIHVVEGDVVSVSGFLGGETVPGTSVRKQVLTGGLVQVPTGRGTARVATITQADLSTWEGASGLDGMVVRLPSAPLNTYDDMSRIVQLYGGGALSLRSLDLGETFERGTCAASAGGLMLFGESGYADSPALQPRVPGDFDRTPTTGCLPYGREFTVAECEDGIDNDWDSRVDCDGSELCAAACACLDGSATATAVKDIRDAPPGYKKLEGLAVTATIFPDSPSGMASFHASDADATATPWGGIEILYDPVLHQYPALAVGQRVTVVARAARDDTSFYDGSSGTTWSIEGEYGAPVYVAPGEAGSPPEPAVVTATQLAQDGAPWDNQLVRLEQHRLTSGFTPYGLLSDGTSTILFRSGGADIVPGSCLASVTGIALARCGNRPATNPCMQVIPRSPDDIVTGGTSCP